MLIYRFSFYVSWQLTEGSTILSGYSFNGYQDTSSVQIKQKKARWNRTYKVHIPEIEFCRSSVQMLVSVCIYIYIYIFIYIYIYIIYIYIYLAHVLELEW